MLCIEIPEDPFLVYLATPQVSQKVFAFFSKTFPIPVMAPTPTLCLVTEAFQHPGEAKQGISLRFAGSLGLAHVSWPGKTWKFPSTQEQAWNPVNCCITALARPC